MLHGPAYLFWHYSGPAHSLCQSSLSSRQEDMARATQEEQSGPERSPRHWKRPKTEADAEEADAEEVL